jgi:hypothetical protein
MHSPLKRVKVDRYHQGLPIFMENTDSMLSVIIKIDDLEPHTGQCSSFIIMTYDEWKEVLALIDTYFNDGNEFFINALDDSEYYAADKEDLMSDLTIEFLQPEELAAFKKHFPVGKVGVLSNLLNKENFNLYL